MRIRVRSGDNPGYRGLFVGLMGIGLTLALASCASTPKPTTSAATTPAATTPAATTPAASTAAPTTETATAAPAVPSPDAELSKAQDLKTEIDTYGLAAKLADSYQAGVTALDAGKAAMGSDNAAAKKSLDEAASDFQKVVDTVFPQLIATQQSEVDAARSAAIVAKADKAAATQFGNAEALKKQADNAVASKDYPNAYKLLGQTADAYDAAIKAANEARVAAQNALEQANSQLNQSTGQIQSMQNNLNSENP